MILLLYKESADLKYSDLALHFHRDISLLLFKIKYWDTQKEMNIEIISKIKSR